MSRRNYLTVAILSLTWRVLAEAIVLWQQRRGPQIGVLSMSS